MSKVLVLPDHIASQIAAGEVIERPSSIVKELVENSIDAGATQVEIAIASECRDIRVADNGSGMEAEDAVLAFHRHATSKLTSADDLFKIRTMGFRGEALPSIASVSRVTCLTRTHEAAAGTRVECADGKVTAVETGCAPGTVMEITDLFYNVPARMKFLKKAGTEFAHIHETVQALAVAFPKIFFQLLNDGEVILRTTGSGKLAQAAVEAGFLSGKEELMQVTYADMKYGMAVYGYVAKPVHFRGDRKGILSIVNNRFVRCPLTYKALDYAYSDLIPKGKYPLGVVTVTIDPAQVDINVHPTKKEIKYSGGNDVYITLQRALVETLRATRPEAEKPAPEGVAEPASGETADDESPVGVAAESIASRNTGLRDPVVSEPAPGARPTPARRSTVEQLAFRGELSYAPPAARGPSLIAAGHMGPIKTRGVPTLPAGWRLAGYIHNTYFVFETYEGLEVIEQHIAHERLIYEHLLSLAETPGRVSENTQRLVISAPLDLSPEQRAAVENNLEALRKLGFDFAFQGQSAVCTQVPLELADKGYVAAVQKVVDDMCKSDSANLELEATKSIACQAAVKNGMPLSDQDIILLVSEWLKTPRNDTCPHGRPVRQPFSLEKLFRLFHPG